MPSLEEETLYLHQLACCKHSVYTSVQGGFKWKHMDLTSIDRTVMSPNNKSEVDPLSDAQRKQLGRKLRGLRVDAQLQQKDIAARADLSLGTISAIETNKRPVLQESLEKYAEVFKTSVFELLHADDPPPTDPLWTGLNRDHLQIAHKFKDGLTKPRRAVEILLNEPQGEAVAELVLATQDVPIAAVLALLELWAQKLEPALEGQWTRTLAPGELFAVLAKLAETDPVFLALLRDTIRDPELREETRRFIEEKTKK